MLDLILRWTGAAVWVAIAFVLALLAGELVRAFVVSCSWHRWALCEARRLHRIDRIELWDLVVSFLQKCARHYRSPKGEITYQTANGAKWRGIGDWNLGKDKDE
jgi:hypothetical protein